MTLAGVVHEMGLRLCHGRDLSGGASRSRSFPTNLGTLQSAVDAEGGQDAAGISHEAPA